MHLAAAPLPDGSQTSGTLVLQSTVVQTRWGSRHMAEAPVDAPYAGAQCVCRQRVRCSKAHGGRPYTIAPHTGMLHQEKLQHTLISMNLTTLLHVTVWYNQAIQPTQVQ
jgi:hypothetical protein